MTESGAFGGRRLSGWQFGNAELDTATLTLTVDGSPVSIQRKPLELLRVLLNHPGEVVTKAELIEQVWPGRVISDATLTKAIAKLRIALADHDQSTLRTVHGYGYRLVADVTPIQKVHTDASTLELYPGAPVPHRPRWRLVKQLGTGGYGEVWLGEHEKARDKRVFKFSLDAGQLGSLKREVTLYRLLRDALGERRDLVRILDWNFDELPFFVESDFVRNGNLADWARDCDGIASVPLATRLNLIASIADTLADAHALGVLHKDIKPGNVLIDEDDNGLPITRLTDFGSGMLLDPDRLSELGITRMGLSRTHVSPGESSSGTPLYIAPEVLAGGMPTARSDIYSLGVLLYQLVTADLTRPLTAGWESDIDDPLLREDIAAAADGNPERRLGDARILALRLRSLETRREASHREQRAAEKAARAQAELTRMRARRPWVLGTLTALLAGVVVTTWQWREAGQARAAAEREAAIATAVNRFLNDDLLTLANPLLGGSRDLTVREAAERAELALRSGDPLPEEARIAVLETLASVRASVQPSDELLSLYDELIAFYPTGSANQVRARLNRILALAEMERLDLAQSEYDTLTLPDTDEIRLLHAATGVSLLFANSNWRSVKEQADRLLATHSNIPGRITDELRRQLTYSLRQLEEYEAALQVAEQRHAERVAQFGSEHAASLTVQSEIGAILLRMERYDEAENLLLGTLDRLKATLGPEHWMVGNVSNDLAYTFIYAYRGTRNEEALEYGLAALDILRPALGNAHSVTIAALNNVALIYRSMGDTERAIRYQREAYHASAESLGPDHSMPIMVAINLAMTCVQTGDLDCAAEMLEAVGDNAQVVFGPEHGWTGWLIYVQGLWHEASGRTSDARAAYTRSHAILSAAEGESHPDTLTVAERMAALAEDS
jgi:eukaryotic-like serine/threonine-protein kinase